jgi:[protein-PII] uridylyltransferase
VLKALIGESPVDDDALRAEFAAIAAAHAADSPIARRAALELLKEALSNGQAYIRAELEKDGHGLIAAERLSALMDTLVRGLFEFATGHVFRASNCSPSAATGAARSLPTPISIFYSCSLGSRRRGRRA